MKKITTLLIAFQISLFTFGQTDSINISDLKLPHDSLSEILVEGIFDGIYIAKYGYKINDYYIYPEDITPAIINSFKGKKVIVKGKLKIINGNQSGNIQSTNDNRKYIVEPKFKHYIYKEPEGFISR